MTKNELKSVIKAIIMETLENLHTKDKSWINEAIFHEHKDWMMYEGENKVVTLFKDNTRLQFEVHFRDKRGEDRGKWKKKALSKWKTLAREIYNSTGLTEAGNPVVKPWKECFEEALSRPEMKEFVKRDFNPIF